MTGVLGQPDGALPTAGPWHGACKLNPNPPWGGNGRAAQDLLVQPSGRGSQGNGQRGEAKPCGHQQVWLGKHKPFATAACRDADGGPFPTAGLMHTGGIALAPRGQRQPWYCLDHFPFYSHHPGSLKFFPSRRIAECHLLQDIHVASFVSVNHCQLEGKHGKRQEQLSPADGAWLWGAVASPLTASHLPRLFLSSSSTVAGRDLYFRVFFFPKQIRFPKVNSGLSYRLSPTEFLSCPEQVKAGHRGGGKVLWREPHCIMQGRGANLLQPPPLAKHPSPPGGSKPPCFCAGTMGHAWPWRVKPRSGFHTHWS